MTSGEPEPDEDTSLEELMAGFRRSGGGATARFAAAQAVIIRDLVGQVAELVGGDALDEEPPGERPRGDRPGGPEDGRDDGLASADDLAAMIGLTENAELPADPVLARLLPERSPCSVYRRNSPEASGSS